jgi:hypothetical protein
MKQFCVCSSALFPLGHAHRFSQKPFGHFPVAKYIKLMHASLRVAASGWLTFYTKDCMYLIANRLGVDRAERDLEEDAKWRGPEVGLSSLRTQFAAVR